MDTIRALLRANYGKPVVVIGDGDFADKFADAIQTEVFAAIPKTPFPQRKEDYILPIYFNLVNHAGRQRGAISYKIRFGNDLTANGIIQRNTMMNLRGIMAIVKRAAVCITPDSMLSHLAAAFDVPCVTVFGPFDPRWRVSTYPKGVSVWRKDLCDVAPCSWHNAGLPVECPSKETGACAVLTGTTIQDIEVALARAMEFVNIGEVVAV